MNRDFRLKSILILLLILSLVLPLVGCKEDMIKVRTGSRIVCKYGHVIEDNTRVIKVPKSLVSKYKLVTIRKLCKKHKKIEELLNVASEALREGDEVKAEKTLRQILKQEPKLGSKIPKTGNLESQVAVIENTLSRQEAQARVENPVSGSTNTSATVALEGSEGSPGAVTAQESPKPSSQSAALNLLSLLPPSLEGYTTGTFKEMGSSVGGSFIPKKGTKAESLIITIYGRDSTDRAAEFISTVSKVAFSKDSREDIKINDLPAYFGTDGTRYATLAWHKGNIVYELVMRSPDGPAGLYEELLFVASQMPK